MRRARAFLSLAALSWAGLPLAALAAPSAADIVDKCVKALESSSYKATMRYQSVFEGGEEREVLVHHVAPDLYRVDPLEGGRATGETFYIENASELSMIRNGTVVVLPERQYSLNDGMTRHFLRDLGRLPGTSVLNGQVGQTEVWALRQDVTREKPYLITVGVDKQTYFPVYLMVNDAQGRRRVYYEMESISIVSPDALDDRLFTVPDSPAQQQLSAPRAARMASAAAGGAGGSLLPLFPAWLPDGYRIEALRMLDCPAALAKADARSRPVIYQLEVYGPSARDLVSIFQTQSAAAQDQLEGYKPGRKSNFVVGERDGWMVVVFGTPRNRELESILEGLTDDDHSMQKLLQRTLRLDALYEEVTGGN